MHKTVLEGVGVARKKIGGLKISVGWFAMHLVVYISTV